MRKLRRRMSQTRGILAAGWCGWVLATGAETPPAASGNATISNVTAGNATAQIMTAANVTLAAAKPLIAVPVVMESRYFQVAAPDYASAQTVLQMARRLEANLGRYFTWPNMEVRAIQVQLVPAAEANFAAPFKVLSEEQGHRVALVRWDADTKFTDVCLAMSSAALARLVAWQNGAAEADKVPDWMKIGFGMQLETSLKPAAQDREVAQAGLLPVLSLRQIMTAKGPYGDTLPVLTVNAYWLLRFLVQEAGDQDRAKPLIQKLAAGQAPADVLLAAFPGKFSDPQSLEMWWAVGYHEMLAERAPPIHSMAQTRALLDGLQAIVVEAGGQDRKIGLDAAWPVRQSARARAALQLQLDSTRAELPWANPVYYNSVWSLAACLQTLLKNDKPAYEAAWQHYTDDRAKAEATQGIIMKALVEAK
jgi:hypothetical protein